MAICFCKKHGDSGVVSCISKDVCEDVLGRSNEAINNIYIVVIKVFDAEEFLFDQINYVSESIFKLYNLSVKYEVHSESDEENLNSFFPETSGACGKCFEEYILSRNLIA
ncbi:MAG: hypothetical protein B0W54_06630 [Cellvibrio sp. 79]|nr:MAG: hypothetical protein B0W54_06630 [Cellvibrio sp. 79]